MFLILYIKDHNHGSWLAGDERGIKYILHFYISRGEDSSLKYLDKFFKKFKLNWRRCQGIGLIIKEASLTQVKVFSTVVNVLAWQFNLPSRGSFYSDDDIEKIYRPIFKKLKKQKKFKPLKIKYHQKPDITIGRSKHSYKIVK